MGKYGGGMWMCVVICVWVVIFSAGAVVVGEWTVIVDDAVGVVVETIRCDEVGIANGISDGKATDGALDRIVRCTAYEV